MATGIESPAPVEGASRGFGFHLSMALKKSPKMADKIPHFSGLKSPHGREKMAILWP
jgi:hypothetical protein